MWTTLTMESGKRYKHSRLTYYSIRVISVFGHDGNFQFCELSNKESFSIISSLGFITLSLWKTTVRHFG